MPTELVVMGGILVTIAGGLLFVLINRKPALSYSKLGIAESAEENQEALRLK
jgi:hypothetical protein